MICSKKIRPFHPAEDLEVGCRPASGHVGVHQGEIRDYAHPGSLTKLYWVDSDRRTFAGTWVACDDSRCMFPAGHCGGHEFVRASRA